MPRPFITSKGPFITSKGRRRRMSPAEKVAEFVERADALIGNGADVFPVTYRLSTFINTNPGMPHQHREDAQDLLAVLSGYARGDQKARVRALIEESKR